MNAEQKEILKDKLADFIQREMPWPYLDLDRDSEEATEQADEIADGVLPAIVTAFEQIETEALKLPPVDPTEV